MSRKPRFKKNISKEELVMIIESLPLHDVKYRLIFKIMAYMGLRVGEVVKIKISDIFEDKMRVKIEKSEKILERIIPDSIKHDLWMWLQIRPDVSEYLFTPTGRSKSDHIKPATIQWKLYKITSNLGLKDCYFVRKDGKPLHRISCHTFRHYFITNFYEKSGFDIVLTKEVIGHRDLETTERYISPENREKEIVNMIS